MIIIDTHVLIWLAEGNALLGAEALFCIDEALVDGRLAVSAISFWETAMLVAKKRVQLQLDLDDWRKDLLEKGLQEIPVHGGIALLAGKLQDFHGDQADRMIVATALRKAATLITADQKILAWRKPPRTLDARR